MSQKHVNLVMWVHNNDKNNEHLRVLTEILERIHEDQLMLEIQSATIQIQRTAIAAAKSEILKLNQELKQFRGSSR
jgi:uncharacterized protein HemY